MGFAFTLSRRPRRANARGEQSAPSEISSSQQEIRHRHPCGCLAIGCLTARASSNHALASHTSGHPDSHMPLAVVAPSLGPPPPALGRL
eukprot:1740591-Alexandrium_andersonii.AAC.1